METKKRERSANFNSAEVQLLVSLVGINKLIIENKKTDAITNKDKESAWNKIETSFNSSWISSIERSWKTLKLKYEGVKKGTKNKSSIQRQEMYRTGGGPSNAPEFTDVEGKVMSICSNIKGLDARHDSDTIKSVPISISDMVIMDVDELRGSETPNNAEDIGHLSIPGRYCVLCKLTQDFVYFHNYIDWLFISDINESLTFEQTDDIKIIDNQRHKGSFTFFFNTIQYILHVNNKRQYDRFTGPQRAYCVKQFYLNNFSLITVRRLFRVEYGLHDSSQCPSAPLIKKWVKKFEETGSTLNVKQTGGPRTSRSEENVQQVSASVRRDPGLSTRKHIRSS
ncbi:unnamed protein product [Diatraea saccharalis]|uniref:Regulatory protein zeste n=1 Tax=Diatraea saccharalis TaxID=40085 RepID=A0A9N9RA87_9NEOP|nr:unnamed protein product [Diatraea saccharalis]